MRAQPRNAKPMSIDVITVLVADDHPMMRDGISSSIQSQPDMRLVGEAGTGREALELFRLHQPDITLMDLQMPVMSGIDAIIAIREEFPSARIIVLTTYRGDVQAARAIRAGACGYLLKNLIRKELIDTIRTVASGERVVSAELAVEMASHLADEAISEREAEVLRHVARGQSNRQIAGLLSVTEDTVKGHMRHIMAKLGARDRTHAVMIAVERGIIGF
jgi:DNA-binding NarL/FixJ family response regulator